MSRHVGVTETLRELLPAWTVPIFEALSLPGDPLVIVPALGLLALADGLRSLREISQTDSDGSLCSGRTAFVIATVFGGLSLVILLKTVFSAPRPPAELHAVSPSPYGFPSGHTMAAAVTWGAIGYWSPIGSRDTRRRLAAVGVVVALVALSRLALGVHYLVDVLASIGFAVTYLAIFAWVTRRQPGRAFLLAITIAIVAAIFGSGSDRALLALVGTIGTGGSWWLLERPPVRRRIVHVVGRRS